LIEVAVAQTVSVPVGIWEYWIMKLAVPREVSRWMLGAVLAAATEKDACPLIVDVVRADAALCRTSEGYPTSRQPLAPTFVSRTTAWIVPAAPWELASRPVSTAPVHETRGASEVVVDVEVDVEVDDVDVVVDVARRTA
jgi:hypothetical protein